MKAAPLSRRDRLRAQLADRKMPGALEALDTVLASVDAGQGTAADAIEALLGAQITLGNGGDAGRPARPEFGCSSLGQGCRLHQITELERP